MDSTTPTSTPSTPTPTPTAAPATSAPSSPVQSERPTTFAEAFARDAAAPTETTTVSPDAAPTTPSVETPASSEPPAPGEPPRERWDSILANAREKAASEAVAQFQQQHGWAMSLDRAAVEAGMKVGQLYQSDRQGFIRNVMADALTDPELAPLVRSEAARVLGMRTQQPQAPDLSPDIPVMDANGQVVAQTYSADRVQQIVQQAIQDALGKELGPIKQDYQTRQQQEQAAKAQQQLEADAKDIYAELSEYPGFQEHGEEIAKVFATIPGDPDKALRKAWRQVVGSKLGSVDQVKAQTLKDLQTQAAASAVNPAQAVVAPTKRVTSFHDLPASAWS